MSARCSWCKDNSVPVEYVRLINGWETLLCPHCGHETVYGYYGSNEELPKAKVGAIRWL